MPRKPALYSELIPARPSTLSLVSLSDVIMPQDAAAAIREAEFGYLGRLLRIFERMETDDHYGGVVAQLRAAISSKPFRIEPAEKSERAWEYVRVVEDALRDTAFDELLERLIDPYLLGTSIYEIMYEERTDSQGQPLAAVTDVRRVQLDLYQMYTQQDGNYGKLAVSQPDGKLKLVEEYDPRKIFHLDYRVRPGEYHRGGTARRCLPWYLIKTHTLLWMAEYAETYGEPFRLARYTQGTLSEEDREELINMLQALGRHGYGLIPDDVQLELIEAARQSTNTIYDVIIQRANNAFTIAVLGANQTVDGGRGGSYAKARVHFQVRHDILTRVAALVRRGMQQIIRAVLQVNYGTAFDPRLTPQFVLVLTSPEDMLKKAQTFTMLSERGVPIRLRQIREEFGLEPVDEDDEVLVGGRMFQSLREARNVSMDQTSVPGPEAPADGRP